MALKKQFISATVDKETLDLIDDFIAIKNKKNEATQDYLQETRSALVRRILEGWAERNKVTIEKNKHLLQQ